MKTPNIYFIKRIILISTIIWITVSTSYGQTNELYFGATISFHNEIRSRMIYGPGYEERTSVTQFFGTGIKIQKKFKKTWGYNIGLNYVKRQYEMVVPFDHCYFSQQGEGCTQILAHVDKYGYKTFEIPLGINKYFVNKDNWELYINLTAITAIDFQSYYYPYIPEMETKKNNNISLFSGSLTSGLGLGYNITKKVKINIEPFIRLIHIQREDPILITGYEEKWTYFDNFGGQLSLLFKL